MSAGCAPVSTSVPWLGPVSTSGLEKVVRIPSSILEACATRGSAAAGEADGSVAGGDGFAATGGARLATPGGGGPAPVSDPPVCAHDAAAAPHNAAAIAQDRQCRYASFLRFIDMVRPRYGPGGPAPA